MKNKVSILIYSLAGGGAERVVSVLLSELKNKYSITLVLMNETIFYEIPDTLHVEYLEKSSSNEKGFEKFLKLPLLAWRYKKICKEHDMDVSLSFMNRPNYINVLAKIFGMKSKVIISERAMPSLQHKNGLQGFINRLLIKFLYKKADIVTANSKGNSVDLIDNFYCKKVVTVHNPFNITTIDKQSKEKVDYRDEEFTFITVGRLDSGKNHKLMINAMKTIDAKLYIIGDGELNKELKKLIKELHLEDKVKLLGRQKNPYKFLGKADCFVFSSNHEGFPNVIVEALACGLPVISTDCKSGPREILAPKSDVNFQLKDDIELAEFGILIPIKNEEKLLGAMKLLIRDKKLREKYAQKAKERASDFTIKKIIKLYEEILCAE